MKNLAIGIDEVGRGSLAGPVLVCAVAIPRNIIPKIAGSKTKLRDSKKLSAIQRERWFKYFTNHPQIFYTVARVYPRKIEKINISRAANLAALRAFKRLTRTYNLKPKTYQVYLDGGLFLGNGKNRLPAQTIPKGDEKITAIKIASIIAKVKRDRQMGRSANKYPRYGFEIHKGYGTKAHLAAIRKFGPSEIHRQTFLS